MYEILAFVPICALFLVVLLIESCLPRKHKHAPNSNPLSFFQNNRSFLETSPADSTTSSFFGQKGLVWQKEFAVVLKDDWLVDDCNDIGGVGVVEGHGALTGPRTGRGQEQSIEYFRLWIMEVISCAG